MASMVQRQTLSGDRALAIHIDKTTLTQNFKAVQRGDGDGPCLHTQKAAPH